MSCHGGERRLLTGQGRTAPTAAWVISARDKEVVANAA
jgi:hypothetical protein